MRKARHSIRYWSTVDDQQFTSYENDPTPTVLTGPTLSRPSAGASVVTAAGDDVGGSFSTRRHCVKVNGRFQCVLCGVETGYYRAAQDHYFQEHMALSYVCDICSRLFRRRHALEDHCKIAHPNVRCCCCAKCGRGVPITRIHLHRKNGCI